MALNLLKGTRAYLIGAMESEKDCGRSWRLDIQDKLKDLGINWFDPCQKHFIKDIQEVDGAQDELKMLRAAHRYDELEEKMRIIRIYDLSLVDKSDFLIFHYDNTKITVGSFEEFFVGNSIKRPIFVIAVNGVDQLPYWFFACMSNKYFYNSIDEAIDMLKAIDSGDKEIDSNRWKLLKPGYR